MSFLCQASRQALVVLLAAASAGCVSAVVDTGHVYYSIGPEEAIEALQEWPIRPQDRHLAAMEKAVSLLEIGQYEESNGQLQQVIEELQHPPSGGEGAVALATNDEAGTYRGEYFEQIYLHTLRITNYLALQKIEAAAREAETALAAIAEQPCGACRFPFTRYLAALTFAHTGRLEEAVQVLLEAQAESPHQPFLSEELDRLLADPRHGEETGFAPPPALDARDHRDLYVLLLLGRGPQKTESALPLPASHVVAWPRYVPRLPAVVTGAELHLLGRAPAYSVVLTDMLQLAAVSLKARAAGLITKEVGKTVVQEVVAQKAGDESTVLELAVRLLFSVSDRADLRHWSSLPATCQVLRIRLPDRTTRCVLVYTTPSGEQIDREVLRLPPTWRHGPLFVARRMP